MTHRVNRLVLGITTPLVLGGCVAAAMPVLTALSVGSTAFGAFTIYKEVQLSTGGSVEVGISTDKLTNDQRTRLKDLRSVAVWPDTEGGGVAIAEALQQSGRFEVVTPSQVRTVLKKTELPENLHDMTTTEARGVFGKTCRQVNTDSMLAYRKSGGKTEANFWTFDRAHTATQFVVYVYDCAKDGYVAELPASIKVHIGSSLPSDEEIKRVASSELVKVIVDLAQNPALANARHRQAPVVAAERQVATPSTPSSNVARAPLLMTTKEIQERLIALGYKPGLADGFMGQRTVNALKAFQRDNGLPQTGTADEQTMLKLR